MIPLNKPVSIKITPINPSLSPRDVKVEKIDFSVTYDNARKVAFATIKPFMRNVTLWSGDEYDKAGQFTDADVDAKMKQIVGKDAKAFLQALVDKRQP